MIVKTSDFVTSIANTKDLGKLDLPQFAFVGKSNVGKSSLINALCNRKYLAKVSSTPGRTKLINVFKINRQFFLIDLPGYGFAQTAKSEQNKWQDLIGAYLLNSEGLRRVFVLIDARREIDDKDRLMFDFLYSSNIPFNIVVTKCDKLSRSSLNMQIIKIANDIGVGTKDIIVSSSKDKKGIAQILEIIENLI